MPNKLSKKKKKVKKVKIMYGGLICPNPSNKAYIMLGHGGASRNVHYVPPNCVYITTTLCGNVNSSHNNAEFLSFFIKNPEIIKNPCSFSNFEAINKFLSKDSKADQYIGTEKSNYPDNGFQNTNFLNMHVNRETCRTSAKCPKDYLFQYKDAVYEPCLYVLTKDGKSYNGPNIKDEHDTAYFFSSGLIDSDNIFDKEIAIELKAKGPWKYPMLTIKNIEELYKYSIYPKTNEEILPKITDLNIQRNLYLKITDPRHPSYIDITNSIYDEYIISGFDFIEMIRIYFSVTQSVLFQAWTGIYYNMSCRQFHKDPSYPKAFQRQLSVENRHNLEDLYNEEHFTATREARQASLEARENATTTDASTNSTCTKCPTPATAAAAAAAGATCCLLGFTAPESAITAAVTAALINGPYSQPKIEKIKREGGKKNKNKTKTKKYYKNKTKRSYKNKPKRSYKK
jgi:hypothetical protein